MAMSLEDLLAEEGFKGRRPKTMTRASSGPVAANMPVYPFLDQHKSGSTSRLRKTERVNSDTCQYDLSGKSPATDRIKGRRSRDIVIRREKLDRGSKNETREKLDRRGSLDVWDVNGSSIGSSGHFHILGDEIAEFEPGNERLKAEVQDDRRYKDIYLNEVYSPPRSKDKHSNGTGEWERNRKISGKDIPIDKRYGNNSNKHLLGGMSSNVDYQRNLRQPGSSSSRSNRSTQKGKSFDDGRSRRRVKIEPAVAELALDEVATQAVISILSSYIKHFLKDENFRTSMHHNCFAALNFLELEEGIMAESKVITNLEQAIETVERAVEERASAKELKKASLQLSVITGLNANHMKDGFTSGIPNSKLSACGHLYLSVIYQLQKKYRIAAKHILQVFCDSPFQARTLLVPELWDYIFQPHLSHLEAWYSQEVDSLADTPMKARKLKLLKKVYDEILDSGTYQFAVYYKDWLTEGVEAPSIPSVHIPSISVQGIQRGGSSSHSFDLGCPLNPSSPQPMVNKKLYDSVFGRLHKPVAAKVEDNKEAEDIDDSIQSSDGSVVEDKRTLTHSLEAGKYKEDPVI